VDDPALFDPTPARRSRGRTRRGLDDDLQRARREGRTLPADLVAVARLLADHLDALDGIVSASRKPYDRVPLATLAQRYSETRADLFGGHDESDPFARLVADLVAVESDAAGAHGA
jgi:hypothetical protein